MKKKKTKIKNKVKNPITYIGIGILLVVTLLTIGFSAFNTSFDIGTLGAVFRIQKDIRVTGVTVDSTTNNAVSNWEDYNVKKLYSSVSLPNSDSTITFAVTIDNIGNTEEGIYSITGLPSNLKYEFTNNNYTLKQMLCDDSDPTLCKLGSKSTILITVGYAPNGYDANNTSYTLDMTFNFKRFHTITYQDIPSVGLPTKVMEDEDVSINFAYPYPPIIDIIGTTNFTYDNTTGHLVIRNVEDELTVIKEAYSYFVNFDGLQVYNDGGSNYYKIFDQFDKTNITSFSRNTSLTKAQVEDKYNNGTAYIISTSASDPNYPSALPIYGWVDNNKLYWWSESEVVYFYPDTFAAFAYMKKLTTVDLTGSSTGKVKNFAHFFDSDEYLNSIIGRIDTNGMVLEYDSTFNYGSDSNEGPSSKKGMAFMFNDCKRLTTLDTSEFKTKYASDMKRMFAGCNALATIDLTNFDTSNVKSMYWMFRKANALVDVDLSTFNTEKVENMTGMFVQSSNIETIRLGDHFKTPNVKRFNYMFYGIPKLTTIYAKNDFVNTSMVNGGGSNMFTGSTQLVGASGKSYATPYNSSYVTIDRAKIASATQAGYFTYDTYEVGYSITYNLNGGDATNPSTYYETSGPITLANPTKIGYTFIGWTGSNGNTPQLNVTIPTGTTGNLSYTANYTYNSGANFPKVFSVSGTCNFNGASVNITSDNNDCKNDLTNQDYTNDVCIDTGIQLFNATNDSKDFEIYLEISNYVSSNQEPGPNNINNGQNTIMNSKSEGTGYPGIVFRKSGNDLEVKSWTDRATKGATSVSSVKIIRVDGKIYYSYNNSSSFTPLNDTSTLNGHPFNLNVRFGCSEQADGTPFRHIKAKLSNFYIKLGTFSFE